MPRSLYPRHEYHNSFRRSFSEPDSGEEENELERARELYKNLQGSPGGWQTRALQGQSQQLKRRLGENEQQFRQREQEYERRIREGEDARSLLGSQLDESRIEYGGLQRRYGDLESQVNQRNKDREEKRRAFQEAYDKDYIEKQLLPVIRNHYPLVHYPGYKDLESLAEYKGSGYKPGMTGEAYRNAWNHPNYQHVYQQFPAYQPPQYPQKMDLYSRYGGLKTDYDNLQKRNSESESLYQARMEDWKNQISQDPLAQGYNPDYQQPKLQEYRTKFLEKNVYPMAKYLMEQNAIKKPELKNHPWIKGFPNYLSNEGLDPLKISDEDVWKKQQYVNERAPSEMVKKYPPYKPPNAKMTLPEYRKYQLGKIYSQQASELQSQSERFSEMYDKSIDPFANLLRDIQPKKYDEIMFGEMTPKMSQSAIYSVNAPKSFYESIKSNYDWQSNARKKNETDLNHLRGQYDQHLQKYNQNVKEYEDSKNKLTGDANVWKAKHDELLPYVQEYKNYRRDVSPLRREHPSLADFRKRYNHVNLKTYDQIPDMKKAYEEGAKYVNQFKGNYDELLKRKKAVDQFIYYYPGTGSGLYKALGYGEGAKTMNPWSWASK